MTENRPPQLSGGLVQTVTGRVAPSQLGFTLTAEHFYTHRRANEVTDLRSAWPLVDHDVLLREAQAFRSRGGGTVVDTTPACLGRNPDGLRALSEASGLRIVMATGWYTDLLTPSEDDLLRRSTNSLADQLVDEIRHGVGESHIQPGVIGEFGATNQWLSPLEERIHRASARAHRATGIALSTHALGCDVGLAQLDLFEEEGVDFAKVAIGHCDSWPVLDYWLEIAQRGAYVQLDLLGFRTGPYEQLLVELMVQMISLGHTSRLLLSHDMSAAAEMSAFGGFGLVHISDRFIPLLVTAGVTQDQISEITVSNPARFLAMPDDGASAN